MTWIQADGLAQLTSGLLVAVQDEQVEAQLLVPAGVLGTYRDRPTEELFRDDRTAEFDRKSSDAQPGLRVVLHGANAPHHRQRALHIARLLNATARS